MSESIPMEFENERTGELLFNLVNKSISASDYRIGMLDIERLKHISISFSRWLPFINVMLSDVDGNSIEGLALAWTIFTLKGARLAISNYSKPDGDLLLPIARSCLEHSVWINVLTKFGISEAAAVLFIDEPLKMWTKRIEMDFANEFADDKEREEFVNAIQSSIQRPNGDELVSKKFRTACNRFKDGDQVYETYQYLSNYVHPSFVSSPAIPNSKELAFDGLEQFIGGKSLGIAAIDICFRSLGWATEAVGRHHNVKALLGFSKEIVDVVGGIRFLDPIDNGA